MENESLQVTTDIEVIPTKEYSTFGGWLRFFQILNIFSVTLISLVIVAAITFSILDYYEPHEYIDLFAATFELTPEFIIGVITLKLLAMKNSDTPLKIVKYIGYYVWATIAVYSVLYYLFKSGTITDKPVTFWGSVIYYYIWATYFKKSKRVKGYYGANYI